MRKLFLAFAMIFALSLPAAVFAEETTIDEQVIYDEDGRKVTVTGYDEDWYGPAITVKIENNSDSAFTLQIRDSSVNGIMTDLSASIEVQPGKTAVDDFSMSSSELEENGIEQVADVELKLHFFDPDSYETIVDSDPVSIVTNLSGSYEQAMNDAGEEVYNNNRVRIIFQGIYEDSFWGPEPMFYIENNSDKEIEVQLRDTSVNGIMIDPSFAEEIMPGKVSINGAFFSTSEMEEKGITEINELDTSFHIFDPDSYDNIDDSDIVTIQINESDGSEPAEVSGETVYDENGILIVSQGLKEDSIWGAEMIFYIENNSDQEICVQMRDTSVNDIMVDPSFSEEVMPGKTSISTAILFSSDAEKVGEIKELETSFHIFEKNTYDTIVDTDSIVITY